MKTNNFLEKLINYFENTPREQVLADWAKSEEYDNVGLTVQEFLSLQRKRFQLVEHQDSDYTYSLNNINPKFTSGFLLKSYRH